MTVHDLTGLTLDPDNRRELVAGEKTTWILEKLLLIAALYFILTYFVLASLRAQYPFELEWMEGGMIDHIERILQGKPLYAEPSLEFTSYIYAPLYFYAAALLSKITWVGFGAARFVSIVSSIWCLLVVFLIVYRQTENRDWGLMAAGLFAATFRISGAWFDLARVDTLYLALMLTVLYVTLFCRSRASGVLAGLAMALACLTKQNGLILAAAFALYYLFFDKRAAVFIAVVATAVGGVSLKWNLESDGWYFFYLFELPSNHPIFPGRYTTFWTEDILPHLPVVVSVTAVWLLSSQLWKDRPKAVLWVLVVVSTVGSSLLGRVHSGGYDNVLMPAYAILAVSFGLGISSIHKKLLTDRNTYRNRMAILCGLCLLQFALLIYDPAAQVPTDNDMRAGMSLLSDIRKRQGDVLIPFHGRLGRLAGKRSWAHQMALHDVIRGSEAYGESIRDQINDYVSERRFSAIVLDRPWNDPFLKGNYILEDSIHACNQCFYPVTGYRVRPEVILVPSK